MMYLSILWIIIVVLIGALASIPLIVFGKMNSYAFCTQKLIYFQCIGIRGFANLEECAIGALHSLDAFNFLTGI